MMGVRWVGLVALVTGTALACGESGRRGSRSDGDSEAGEGGGPGQGQGGSAAEGPIEAGAGGVLSAGGSTSGATSSGGASAGRSTTDGGANASGGVTSTGGESASGGVAAGGTEAGAAGEGATGGEGGARTCVVDDSRSCVEAGLLGRCAAGVQRCDGEGNWGECSVLPEADGCTPGDDADCDGIPNEGCPCTDDAQQACGPATGSGHCERGVSTCVGGAWSACENAVYPGTRNCRSSEDNDCDGKPDDTEDLTCECTPGATIECDTHPEDGQGVCRAGTRTCLAAGNGSSSSYGPCEGSVGPGPELCFDDDRDEDCDGEVNEAVVCEAVVGVDVAAGSNHSCVLLSDGTARCWGHNSVNELGDGSGWDSSVPVVASAVSGFNRGTSIDSSARHTCVVTREARVNCWGIDEYDQLGYGFESQNVIGVGAGTDHTCALIYGGLVRCWGRGSSGRLGFSTPWLDYSSWVPVYNVNTATSLAVGLTHSCALMEDGTVRCWGANSSGQVGDGSGLSAVDSGQLVLEVEDAVAVTAGGAHSCAVLEGGSVKCWGANGSGQLGDGTTMPQPVASTVLGITDAVAVEAGGTFTCAIRENGTVKCWGENSSGQLGDGTNEVRSNPVTVKGLEHVRALAAGFNHTCAVLENGRVWCWGINSSGQLGNGTEDDAHEPVEAELP